MEQTLLEQFCELESHISKIPIAIYKGNGLIASWQMGDSPNVFRAVVEGLLKDERSVGYHLTKELLQFGIVRDESSDLSVVIGPARLVVLSNDEINHIAAIEGLRLDAFPAFRNYIKAVPMLQFDRFISFLQILFLIVNRRKIEVSEIWTSEPDYTLESSVNEAFVKTNRAINYGDREGYAPYSLESQLLFYISHGMVDKLENLFTDGMERSVGRTANGTMRHYKNIVLILNSLAARAAIKGGLPAQKAYSIAEVYAQKIELCNQFDELSYLSKHLRLDYCIRVRELQYADINDLNVNRAIKYITAHVTEKITVQDIADSLHISPQYLSTHFKKVVKIGLVDYINRAKVTEAQYILAFTDDSLVNISNYLSFSSQSYFQSVFKKYTGCTPSEYRTESKNKYY